MTSRRAARRGSRRRRAVRAPPGCYESAVARRSTSPTRRRHQSVNTRRNARFARTPGTSCRGITRVHPAGSPFTYATRPGGTDDVDTRVPERLGYPRHHWLREIADTNTPRWIIATTSKGWHDVTPECWSARSSLDVHLTHTARPIAVAPAPGRKRVRNATEAPICSPNGMRVCRRSAALLCDPPTALWSDVPRRHSGRP